MEQSAKVVFKVSMHSAAAVRVTFPFQTVLKSCESVTRAKRNGRSKRNKVAFTVKLVKHIFHHFNTTFFQFRPVLISSMETNKMLLIDKVMTAPAANDQSLLITFFPACAFPFGSALNHNPNLKNSLWVFWSRRVSLLKLHCRDSTWFCFASCGLFANTVDA